MSKALAQELNERLALPCEVWEEFSSLGDGENVQAYLKLAGYGVIGHPGNWTVVFAEDGTAAIASSFVGLGEAMVRAQEIG